ERAVVGMEVRAADRGQRDADDGVPRLLHQWLRHVGDGHGPGAVEDGRPHGVRTTLVARRDSNRSYPYAASDSGRRWEMMGSGSILPAWTGARARSHHAWTGQSPADWRR